MRPPVRLMGIVNLTPDSFSDGGKFMDMRLAVDHARRLVDEGADLLDLGAESTRAGSEPVHAGEQLRRLLPALKELVRLGLAPISIDTQSAEVARVCLAEGATLINDISALRSDERMAEVLASSSCGVVLMHMQGAPHSMQKQPAYSDVIGEIRAFFTERLETCERAGIKRERVILDPGIGFGKTVEHNCEILRKLGSFAALGCPLLVGVSRKSMLGALTGEAVPERRVAASVAAGLFAVQQGATLLRVHDVKEHKAALAVWGILAQ